MKIAHWVVLIACVSGCAGKAGLETGDPAGTDEHGTDGRPASVVRELSCVSEASVEGDETAPSVWRITASVSEGGARVVLARGPEFRSRGGSWNPGGESFSVNAVATETLQSLTLEASEYPPMNLELGLERRGAFFVGDFQRADASAALVCWDTLEVFGERRSLLFPAHYDPALGICVDATGAPALNDVPIEFVRETSSGECADLRDAALNDQDFGDPDLALNLRGALLDGATLHFANLSGSLQGARFRKLVFGYARITGIIDDATELPIGTACDVVDSPWAGKQVTCVR